jgi:hypothetical protein
MFGKGMGFVVLKKINVVFLSHKLTNLTNLANFSAFNL